MTLETLRNLAPGIYLMRLPISRLSLCPSCGTLYLSAPRFWCKDSQGFESEEATCPSFECREIEGEGLA